MTIFQTMWIVTVGIFGLMFGSFLNVVIYRLPLRESLVYPSSHCPVCGGQVKWFDNIPVLSYLLLGGKCRTCKTRISPVYPFIELATAIMAMWLFYLHGKTIGFVSDFILACILLAAACIDLRYMIIPDRLNAAGATIGVIITLVSGVRALIPAVFGAAIGIILLMLS